MGPSGPGPSGPVGPPAPESGWESAGMLLLTDPSSVSMLPTLRDRLLTCLEGDGIVMAVGQPAAGFGEEIRSPLGGMPGEGLGWLPGSVVLTEGAGLGECG